MLVEERRRRVLDLVSEKGFIALVDLARAIRVSESTLRLSPLQLADSQQLRLKRLYPGAHYRATTSTVQVPIPRAGSGVGAPRIRDLELVAVVAGLVLALEGKPQEGVDITKFGGTAMSDKRQLT